MSNIHSSDLLHTENVVFHNDTVSRLFPGRVRPAAALDYYGESQLTGNGGGDFFDFLSLPSDGLITALGEVSGQTAAAAALLVPGLRAFLRTHVPGNDVELGNIVRNLNRSVCDASPDSFYTTLFYAWFEPSRRLMRYVNAGHEPALLVRDRGRVVVRLDGTGTVLGLTTRAVYRVRTLALEPEDVLVAFTGGLVESAGESGLAFGESGVLEAIREEPDARATTMVAHILDHAGRFAGSSTLGNDRTVAVVRFNHPAEAPILADETAVAACAAA